MKWNPDFTEYVQDNTDFLRWAVALAIVALLVLVGLTFVSSTAWRINRLQQDIDMASRELEVLRDTLDRWRVLEGGHVWALEYPADVEGDRAAVVYARWLFQSRDEADDFLFAGGRLIDRREE